MRFPFIVTVICMLSDIYNCSFSVGRILFKEFEVNERSVLSPLILISDGNDYLNHRMRRTSISR